MRIGVSTWAWSYPFDWSRDLDLVEHQASLGADHFELGGEATGSGSPFERRELRRRLDDRAMSSSICGLFSADRDLSSLAPAARAAGVDHLKACIDLAVEIGAHVVVGAICGTGGTHIVSEEERRERIDIAAAELVEVAAYAASGDVRIGVEALNRYENNLLNLQSQTKQLIDAVDHPNVGFHLDLFHASIEESNLEAAIRLTGSRLVHSHAVDNNRLAPGGGHAPWSTIAATLHEIGYDGALVIETFDPDNEILAPLAGFWRPLPRPQDDLVRTGIALLRDATAAAA